MTGKIPPQAIELEEAVLGAIILHSTAITEAAPNLKPEIFYKHSHQVICESILSLYRDSEPIDLLTVTSQLKSMGKLEKAGGAFYVTELTSK